MSDRDLPGSRAGHRARARAGSVGRVRHAVLLAVSVASALIAWSGDAGAQLYRYVDATGVIVYTNVAPSHGSWQSLGPSRPYVLRSEGARAHPAAAPASPSKFPRVDGSTQRDRDSLRRRILEDELRSETDQLAAAGGRADVAEQHRRNIESLRKEISYLRP